ncbi:hypothetical protein JKP88DRAFT_207382 [Tribonema minus]|uniref:Uncharacterized protein n=1 Tax=Tribonema minus TaxID=303371 RepID=A0A835Z448_9STRA|nr:hypothetical protein JKP88DRAFT_207382 [Tribonema minus]
MLQQLAKGAMVAGAAAAGDPSPSAALFEDVLKEGGCPKYDEVKGPSVAAFDMDKYMGVWYELAYHDWTQYSICGCTRFNMTRRATTIEDMFTTQCPRSIGQTYAVNMSMAINPATPGQFLEKAFYTDWPNMVLDVWAEGDAPAPALGAGGGGGGGGAGGAQQQGGGKPRRHYGKAIQMQCVEVMGRRAFVGINFLSRTPVTSDAELAEMWERAERLGIARYGGNRAEMERVDHTNCKYPRTTDNGVIFRKERAGLGALLGVKILDQSLMVSLSGA